MFAKIMTKERENAESQFQLRLLFAKVIDNLIMTASPKKILTFVNSGLLKIMGGIRKKQKRDGFPFGDEFSQRVDRTMHYIFTRCGHIYKVKKVLKKCGFIPISTNKKILE